MIPLICLLRALFIKSAMFRTFSNNIFSAVLIQDYSHELVCITEREKFIVPVRAIGARAILDFPDEINFPIGPVKYPSTKTILVRNIGNKEGKISLSVDK